MKRNKLDKEERQKPSMLREQQWKKTLNGEIAQSMQGIAIDRVAGIQ